MPLCPEAVMLKDTFETTVPRLILFDWHGTLVDTTDAMYQSVEALLNQLDELGLTPFVVPEEQARNAEDEKLLRYIRIFRHLQPKILAERRISRTDIFDVLFGGDECAKKSAHRAYNEHYRRYYGAVTPLQDGTYNHLRCLKNAGIRLGVVTNRSREFFDREMDAIEGGRWRDLFEVTLCGEEAKRYKPAPDIIHKAAGMLGEQSGSHIWYVGDSVSDMRTARHAGISAVFYNGPLWPRQWFRKTFAGSDQHCAPQLVINDFDALLDALESIFMKAGQPLQWQRPTRMPPRQQPAPYLEPDWHPSVAKLTAPSVILFDWHATLVDTLDAMYHAVEDTLADFDQLGLTGRLVNSGQSRSREDEKLVAYVRDFRQLHPKIKADRKISRTDIIEVLFGCDEEAKRIAHRHFTTHYRKYFGTALPFEPNVRKVLQGLNGLGLTLGVITNRDREFFVFELGNVNGEDWSGHFGEKICGDDTARRKPHPDQLQLAMQNLGIPANAAVWYVGDSTTDTIAAKTAGITSVFFNGAQWDQSWLNKIFPGSENQPHKPDVVVNDFSEFWAMLLACRSSTK